MQKMNNALLESFLSENVKKGSQKVWRSNIKKIIIMQDENTEIEFLNDLISKAKNDPRWDLQDSTWHTIEKNTNSFLSWLNNQSPKIEIVEEVVEEKVESSESIKEGLRQKQEALKISCERQALLEKEAKEESARLEAVLEKEAEEFAQKEAIRKEEASKKRLEQLFGNFESEEIPEHYMPFDMEAHRQKTKTPYFEQKNEWKKIISAIRAGKHIIATGHAGTGKTEVSINSAEFLKGYHFKVGATSATKLIDLIGSKTINKNQEVKLLAGVVTQAILTANKTGEWVILTIDEINCLSEKIQKILNGLCDGTRFLDLPEGRLKINSGAKIVIFGTMNNGYNGTNSVNIELKDRFVFQKFNNLPDKILHKIFEPYNADMELEKKVIQLAKEIEKSQKGLESNPLGDDARFTTRSMKTFFELHEQFVMDKIPNAIDEALEMCVVEKFDDESDQKTVRQIIKRIF
jgi:MoxR-like ATPase